MLNGDTSEFDIRIKDNFFSEKDFNFIKNVSKKINFGSVNIRYSNKNDHVFFTTDAPKKICDIVSKKVSDFFKINILNISLCQFSLVAKSNKVEVHNDKCENTNFQTILYIEGNEDIHCGTGFYVAKGRNKLTLNSHIGFKPNRIVSWSANVYHAPLSFSDEYKPRISLITQYKLKQRSKNAK